MINRGAAWAKDQKNDTDCKIGKRRGGVKIGRLFQNMPYSGRKCSQIGCAHRDGQGQRSQSCAKPDDQQKAAEILGCGGKDHAEFRKRNPKIAKRANALFKMLKLAFARQHESIAPEKAYEEEERRLQRRRHIHACPV